MSPYIWSPVPCLQLEPEQMNFQSSKSPIEPVNDFIPRDFVDYTMDPSNQKPSQKVSNHAESTVLHLRAALAV